MTFDFEPWWSPQGNDVPADTWARPAPVLGRKKTQAKCEGCVHLHMPRLRTPFRHCAFSPDKRRRPNQNACEQRKEQP